MRTTQVAVTARVHEASLTAPDQLDLLFCVAEIEPWGRLRTQDTRPSSSSGGPGQRVSWEEVSGGRCGAGAGAGNNSNAPIHAALHTGHPPLPQDLCFTLGPSDRAQHLSLVLFRPAANAPGGHQYVAAGSLGLEPLLEAPSARHEVSVPVVDEVSSRRSCPPAQLCAGPARGVTWGAVRQLSWRQTIPLICSPPFAQCAGGQARGRCELHAVLLPQETRVT